MRNVEIKSARSRVVLEYCAFGSGPCRSYASHDNALRAVQKRYPGATSNEAGRDPSRGFAWYAVANADGYRVATINVWGG